MPIFVGMKSLTLREARTKAGLTQDELAERSGVDQTTISSLECGRRANPSLNTVMRLAKALGVAMTRLVFDTSATSESNDSAVSRELV